MTKEEYTLFITRYGHLNANNPPERIERMIALQEAAFRTFIQYKGHEIIWEAETAGRVNRQRTFRRLARHGKR
jgi:hypothetical protein